MYKLDLEKTEEPGIELPTSFGLQKSKGILKITYFYFTNYTKCFGCVDHNKLWKILKELGIPDYLTYLLRNLNASQEAIIRTLHRTTDWFKIGKEYSKVVYCHPVYLTSMQDTS